MNINKEFVKIISENPNLPIKAFVNGECYNEQGSWFVGEVSECEVTEIATYNEYVYAKDDLDYISEQIFNDICDFEEYEKLTVDEIDKIARKQAEKLDWEKCILIRVTI